MDEHLIVSEAEVKAGMVHIFEHQRLIAEGAAAVGVAALMAGKLDVTGKRVATVLTGRSVDSAQYLEILREGIERR